MNICIKPGCYSLATVAEPCCAAPDCVDESYLLCGPCDAAEWDALADSAADEYDAHRFADLVEIHDHVAFPNGENL